MGKIKALFKAIKARLDQRFDKVDLYAALALVIMLVAALTDRIGLALIAPLPAMIAGFFLALGTEPDDDDDGDDDFEEDDGPDEFGSVVLPDGSVIMDEGWSKVPR